MLMMMMTMTATRPKLTMRITWRAGVRLRAAFADLAATRRPAPTPPRTFLTASYALPATDLRIPSLCYYLPFVHSRYPVHGWRCYCMECEVECGTAIGYGATTVPEVCSTVIRYGATPLLGGVRYGTTGTVALVLLGRVRSCRKLNTNHPLSLSLCADDGALARALCRPERYHPLPPR
eukprot:1690822-Rhodomonas_salina.1